MIRVLPAFAAALLVAQLARPAAASPLAPQDPVASAERMVERMIQTKYPEKREEIWGELVALAGDIDAVRPVVAAGLVDLWEGANRRLATRATRREFARVLEARAELDALRAETLALVRDEEAYPYPFAAPDATPEQAEAFLRTQRKIDRNVEAMRELWTDSPKGRMSRAARRGGERVLWARRKQAWLAREMGLEVALEAPDVPAWMHSLPVEQESDDVDLRAFALTPEEARRVARDVAVLERNGLLLDAFAESADGRADPDLTRRERDQLDRTNDYRRMLGVPVLGWSPDLQWAVRNHAEYLVDMGIIGHEQPEPALATFQKRAKWFGYEGLVWENCHVGSTSARAALDAWIRSSEHHRTLLNPKLTEMATGNVGKTWVQNFGLDTTFESGIQCHPWRD